MVIEEVSGDMNIIRETWMNNRGWGSLLKNDK